MYKFTYYLMCSVPIATDSEDDDDDDVGDSDDYVCARNEKISKIYLFVCFFFFFLNIYCQTRNANK